MRRALTALPIIALLTIGMAALTAAAVLTGTRLPRPPIIAYTQALAVNGEWIRRPDVYVQDIDRAIVAAWTRTPTINEELAVWSPDGERLAYLINQIDSPHGRICVSGWGTPPVCVGGADGNYGAPQWLAGGQQIAYWWRPIEGAASDDRLVSFDPVRRTLTPHPLHSAEYGLYTSAQQARQHWHWHNWYPAPNYQTAIAINLNAAPPRVLMLYAGRGIVRRLTPGTISSINPVWWPG